jgi:hypothetical protein
MDELFETEIIYPNPTGTRHVNKGMDAHVFHVGNSFPEVILEWYEFGIGLWIQYLGHYGPAVTVLQDIDVHEVDITFNGVSPNYGLYE